jgi:hypothetical protein
MANIPITTGELIDTAWLNQVTLARYRVGARTVSNTITETDLFNGGITIEAGAMSTNRTVRVTASGLILNNSAATQASVRWRLKLGAGLLIDTGALAASWTSAATPFGWRLVAEITNTGVTNAQIAAFDLNATGATLSVVASLLTGQGTYSSQASNFFRALGTSTVGTVDTTVPQLVLLTVILPVASTLVTATVNGAFVELV